MAISLSSTHVIDLQAMFGQGLIIPLDELSSSHRAIPAGTGCEKQVTGGRYDQVFATVNHPEHGYIGVTSAERRELGLPESIPVGGLGFRRTHMQLSRNQSTAANLPPSLGASSQR